MNTTKEFLRPKKELVFVEDNEKLCKKLQLSLGPSVSTFAESMNSSSSDSDPSLGRKRKHNSWLQPIGTQPSIELHLNDPLPVDWERCLDLQSGRMYYMNRKTLKKSWERPKEQQLDLELNISTPRSLEVKATTSSTSTATATHDQYPKKYTNSSGSMVAVACLNCHLLVMISKSSPSCPNCKYVHSWPQPRKIEPTKSLETLSLLH